MPRQTTAPKALIFPDGFRLSISTDGTTFSDLGALQGGGTATFNWDEFRIDAGNYRGLVDKFINPTIALAPSDIMDFDPATVVKLFPGFMKSTSATTPTAGTDLGYNGTERYGTLTRVAIKLSHYTVDASGGTETDADIDWEFTLANAKVDAGGSFNFTGAESSDLSSVSISFTAEPKPDDLSKFFTYFHKTIA